MSIRFSNLSATAIVAIPVASITLSAWFYVENTDPCGVLLDSTTGEIVYIKAQGGNVTFSINNIAYSQAISLNTWTHVAITKTGGTQRSYVNGILVDTSTYVDEDPTANYIELDIGSINGPGIITMQDVVLTPRRIFDRYMSQLMYLRLPQNRLTNTPLYFWPMFADCGDKDFSGNGVHFSNAGSSSGVVNAPAAWSGDNTFPIIRAAKRVHAFGQLSSTSSVAATSSQVLLAGSLSTTSTFQAQPVQHISGSLATASSLTGVSSFTIVGELFGPWRDEYTPTTQHSTWLPETSISVAPHAAWTTETDSNPAAHAAWLNEVVIGSMHSAWATEVLSNPATHSTWLTEFSTAGSAHAAWVSETDVSAVVHGNWLNESFIGSAHSAWLDPISSGSSHGPWTNENSVNGGAHTAWQNESIVGTVNLHTAWSEG